MLDKFCVVLADVPAVSGVTVPEFAVEAGEGLATLTAVESVDNIGIALAAVFVSVDAIPATSVGVEFDVIAVVSIEGISVVSEVFVGEIGLIVDAVGELAEKELPVAIVSVGVVVSGTVVLEVVDPTLELVGVENKVKGDVAIFNYPY